MYMYMCIYICIHIYISIHIYLYVSTYISINVYVCIYIYVYHFILGHPAAEMDICVILRLHLVSSSGKCTSPSMARGSIVSNSMAWRNWS